MSLQETYTFDLGDFEGPLDYLVHLIQKNEIDIYGVQLRQIVDQFLILWKQVDVNGGAEFIGSAASLVYLKSRMLLPKHEQAVLPEEEEDDPRFEVIHQLIEYCRFKQAAKQLAQREQQQSGFFLRGIDTDLEMAKRMGIEHISLEDLAATFRLVLAKSKASKGLIHEEEWRVADKIILFRSQAKSFTDLPFEDFFHEGMCREELIVTFLALLEMMKLGEMGVGKRSSDSTILVIFKKKEVL